MNNVGCALITGASNGIGYELARLFAADGYHLVIVARDNDELEKTSRELSIQYGVNVTPIAIDLFDRNNAQQLFQMVQEKGIAVDVLVNNAGQGVYGKFQDTELERELNIMDLNMGSLVVLTKLFLKPMLERGNGKILNLASIASKLPGPWQAVYHGTKAFVLSFSEAIRSELEGTGITVTALMPGATDTDFFNKAGMQESKMVQETELADPAKAAADGYKALMNGTDKVVSGLKNKAQVAMSNMMPDSAVADNMYEQQKPVNQ